MGGGTLEGDGADTFASESSGTSADTTVSYDGLGCQGTGGVGDGIVVDMGAATGDATTRPLGALHMPEGALVRC